MTLGFVLVLLVKANCDNSNVRIFKKMLLRLFF